MVCRQIQFFVFDQANLACPAFILDWSQAIDEALSEAPFPAASLHSGCTAKRGWFPCHAVTAGCCFVSDWARTQSATRAQLLRGEGA
jgi:hypothetical protein